MIAPIGHVKIGCTAGHAECKCLGKIELSRTAGPVSTAARGPASQRTEFEWSRINRFGRRWQNQKCPPDKSDLPGVATRVEESKASARFQPHRRIIPLGAGAEIRAVIGLS